MKKYLLLPALFAHSVIYGQISNVVFAGAATAKDGNTYSYKLQLTDSNGVLSGYSVTDVLGADETRTYVKGTINAAKKQIEFRETNIIYTKSKSAPEDMCYIHARLKVGTTHGTTTLKGSFDSYRKTGDATGCADGQMMLVCAKDIYDKLLEIKAKDAARAQKARPAKNNDNTPVKEKEIPPSHVLKVLPGKTIEVILPSPRFTFDIWDYKSKNGDVVTLRQNNKIILEDHTVSNRHKIVPVTLSQNIADTITVAAVSVGEEGLSAAPIKLICGDDAWFIDAIAAMGRPATIILKRR